MVGHKVRDFRPLTAVSLEDLVPEDNFYRQVERSIDLSFVHNLANDFYSNIGRPSIDPVVFFKLQLIAFFEGIRSERQLMETVSLETFAQGEYRRRDGGSGAKPEKTDQTEAQYSLFFSQKRLFELNFQPNTDFFNSLVPGTSKCLI